MSYKIDGATSEDINWIAKFESEMYSFEDAVPENILREWHGKNPNGFWVIKYTDGRPIGHIDILPLRPEALQKFFEGTIVERDIRGDELYSPEESGLVRNLYVESVAFMPMDGHIRTPAIVYLLSNFTNMASRICNPSNVENIYAIAATTRGERFIKHLGFTLVKAARDRKDRHNLFAARFVELEAKISELCDR